MAIFKVTYKSELLGTNTEFNIVLPESCKKNVPWVLLLHGLNGNQDDWLRFTSVERYAREREIALVLPNASNSWYTDEVYGMKYYSFIVKELVPYIKSMFPLSDDRNKSFVAGLSMGGYGALKIGLKNPDMFGAIASLSGVVDIFHRFRTDDQDKWGLNCENMATRCWGKDYYNVLKNSDENIYNLLNKFDFSSKHVPAILLACGTEDRHFQTNLEMHNIIENKPIEHKWCSKPGKHTWDIWDYYIQYALDFFIEK